MSDTRMPHEDGTPSRGTVELVQHAPGLVVVSVRGEHDLGTSPELTQALEQAAAHSKVVVDLSTCSFIDSTVISALIKSARSVQARGEQFVLVMPAEQRQVARVAQMTQLAEIFPVHPTRSTALTSIQSEE
jgi:anti-sigma B factor antagonist